MGSPHCSDPVGEAEPNSTGESSRVRIFRATAYHFHRSPKTGKAPPVLAVPRGPAARVSTSRRRGRPTVFAAHGTTCGPRRRSTWLSVSITVSDLLAPGARPGPAGNGSTPRPESPPGGWKDLRSRAQGRCCPHRNTERSRVFHDAGDAFQRECLYKKGPVFVQERLAKRRSVLY